MVKDKIRVVYAVSNWPEEHGRKFVVLKPADYLSDKQAIKKAIEAYDDTMEFGIAYVTPNEEGLYCDQLNNA